MRAWLGVGERQKRSIAAGVAFSLAVGVATTGVLPVLLAGGVTQAAGGATAPATWSVGDAAAVGPFTTDAVLLGTASPVEYAYGIDHAGGMGDTAGAAITGPGGDETVRVLEGDTLTGSAAVWDAVSGATGDPAAEGDGSGAAAADGAADAGTPAGDAGGVAPQVIVQGDGDVTLGGALTVTGLAPVGRARQARWQLADARSELVNPDGETAALRVGSVAAGIGDGAASVNVLVLAPAITATLEACSAGNDCDPAAAAGEGGWSVTAATSADASETLWRVTAVNTGNVDLTDVKTVTAARDTETVTAGVGLAFGDVPAGESRTATFTTETTDAAVTLGVTVSGGFTATGPDGADLADRFTDAAGTVGRVPSGVAEGTATPAPATADAAGDPAADEPATGEDAAPTDPSGGDAEAGAGDGPVPEPPCVGRRCLLRDASTSADLRISVSQTPAQASGPNYAGFDFAYQAVVANVATATGTAPANGATVTLNLPADATNFNVTCGSTTGGAVCPTFTLGGTTDAATATATVATFPTNSQFTITVTGKWGVPTDTATVQLVGAITPPAAITDPDMSSNDSNISTPVDSATSLQLSLVPTATTYTPGVPVTFTATFTNNGPAYAAPNLRLGNGVVGSGYFSDAELDVGDCTWTAAPNWTSCPVQLPADQMLGSNNYGEFFDQYPVPPMPPGASLTVVYTVTPSALNPDVCGPDPRNVPVYARFGDLYNSFSMSIPIPSCPETDLGTLVTLDTTPSPLTLAGGVVTGTINHHNYGPNDADNADISEFLRLANEMNGGTTTAASIHFTSCVFTVSGVPQACPVALTDETLSNGQWAWGSTLSSFPVGADLTIGFELTVPPAEPSVPTCGTTLQILDYDFRVTAPNGMTDPENPPYHPSRVAGGLGISRPACPYFDPAVVQLVSSSPTGALVPGAPVSVTASYTNNGPVSGDGFVGVTAYNMYSSDTDYLVYTVHVSNCVWSEGPDCPITLPNDITNPSGANLIYEQLQSWPVGATLTITLEISVEFNANASSTYQCNNTSVPIQAVTGNLPSFQDSNLNNNSAGLGLSAPGCSDVSISKGAPSMVTAGDPLDFVLVVTNSSATAPRSVVVSDVLPSQVTYVGVTCVPAASPAGSACDASGGSYDPVTRRVSFTVAQLAASGGQVTVTVQTTANNVPPGTFQNTATVASAAAPSLDQFWDPVPANNSSQVTFGIENGTSPITLSKTVDYTAMTPGLPEPAEVDLTFTGKMVCQVQGTYTYTVTIPAGETGPVTATWSPSSGNGGLLPAGYWFNGDTCTITEDAGPHLPVGCQWQGDPELTSADFETGTTFTTGDTAGTGSQDTHIDSVSHVEDQLYLDVYVEKLGQDTSDLWVPMAGSQWQILTDVAGSPGLVVPSAELSEVPGETGLWHITGLPVGYYWLVETVTPPGFNLLAQPVGFSVDRVGTVTLGANAGSGPDATVSAVQGTGDEAPYWVMRVKDVPLAHLPAAGGPGDGGVRMAGGLLGGVGVVALWWMWRRRRPALGVLGLRSVE